MRSSRLQQPGRRQDERSMQGRKRSTGWAVGCCWCRWQQQQRQRLRGLREAVEEGTAGKVGAVAWGATATTIWQRRKGEMTTTKKAAMATASGRPEEAAQRQSRGDRFVGQRLRKATTRLVEEEDDARGLAAEGTTGRRQQPRTCGRGHNWKKTAAGG
ncbi:hypothetical protein BHM03_00046064 [Ensete ventricosum]|nr:hypothetical protein BHM03_00046064 [Ensete ventricosum]